MILNKSFTDKNFMTANNGDAIYTIMCLFFIDSSGKELLQYLKDNEDFNLEIYTTSLNSDGNIDKLLSFKIIQAKGSFNKRDLENMFNYKTNIYSIEVVNSSSILFNYLDENNNNAYDIFIKTALFACEYIKKKYC